MKTKLHILQPPHSKMKKYFLSLLLLISFFCHPTPTSASSTITAIPPRLMITGTPGQTIVSDLKVRNDSKTPQTYLVAIDDFIVLDQIGTPVPVSSSVSSRWSLKSWITAPTLLPVDAKQAQIVRITIKIPNNALPGGHYAMITYMPNGEVKPGELKRTATIIGQRVGSLIYVTVGGNITEKANILKFTTPKFLEKGPVEFTSSVENLSDIHINPRGNITIYNPLKSKLTELPVEIGNIFPETTRDFPTTWNQKWGWGRYRADLNLAYGTRGETITSTIYFWLFPIRLVIITLIATVSLLTVIILLNKRRKKHQDQLEKEVRELKAELEKTGHI